MCRLCLAAVGACRVGVGGQERRSDGGGVNLPACRL